MSDYAAEAETLLRNYDAMSPEEQRQWGAQVLANAQVCATLALVDTVQTAARGQAEVIGNTINRVASRNAGAW